MKIGSLLLGISVITLFSCRERPSRTILSAQNEGYSETYFSVELALADHLNQSVDLNGGLNDVPYFAVMLAVIKCGEVTKRWHTRIIEMTENDRMISLRFSLNASEFPLPTCKKSETEIELEKLEFSFTKTHPESHFKPDPALDHLLPFPHTTIDLRTFIEPKQKVYLKYFSVEPKEFPVPMGRYLDDQRRIQPAVGVLKIKRIDNQKN